MSNLLSHWWYLLTSDSLKSANPSRKDRRSPSRRSMSHSAVAETLEDRRVLAAYLPALFNDVISGPISGYNGSLTADGFFQTHRGIEHFDAGVVLDNSRLAPDSFDLLVSSGNTAYAVVNSSQFFGFEIFPRQTRRLFSVSLGSTALRMDPILPPFVTSVVIVPLADIAGPVGGFPSIYTTVNNFGKSELWSSINGQLFENLSARWEGAQGTVHGSPLYALRNVGNLVIQSGQLFFTATKTKLDDNTSIHGLFSANGVGELTFIDALSPINGLYSTSLGLLSRANVPGGGEELFLGTALLKDINPGSGSSQPGKFFDAGGAVYFIANDGIHGSELWTTNGTTAGTVLVKDIQTGAGSGVTTFTNYGAVEQFMAHVNGNVFFTANDGIHGEELWVTDGTADGTKMFADINPGSGSGLVTNVFGRPTAPVLFKFGGNLFFSADDGQRGYELWQTDGTPDGTFQLANVNPAGDFAPRTLIRSGNSVYFSADDSTHGREIWKLVQFANVPPSVTHPIQDQTAIQGYGFTFELPTDTFTDPDSGDTLRYFAQLSDGNPLPPWLHFDGATRTFSGVPGIADLETLSVEVFVRDRGNDKASDTFSLRVVHDLRFDFNASASVTANGHTPIFPGDLYSGAAPYGWLTLPSALSRSTAVWSHPLLQDFHEGLDNTFRVDLPNGRYVVTVYLGDKNSNRRASLKDNGVTRFSDVRTTPGQFAHRTFETDVTDGKLQLRLTGVGGGRFALGGLAIVPAPLNIINLSGPRSAIADGASVLTYSGSSNLDANSLVTVESTRGVVVSADRDPDLAGVQILTTTDGALTFQIRSGSGAGSMEVTADSFGGTHAGRFTTILVAPDVRHFDFNHSFPSTGPTPSQAGFVGVVSSIVYSDLQGYGWQRWGSVAGFDRGAVGDNLHRDGHRGTDATFRVQVDRTNYDSFTVTVHLGDASSATDNVQILLEGDVTPRDTISTASGQFLTRSFTINRLEVSADGVLDIRLRDIGGLTNQFAINGLEITSQRPPIIDRPPGTPWGLNSFRAFNGLDTLFSRFGIDDDDLLFW